MNGILDAVLAYVPRIIGALTVLVVGLVIAFIARSVVTFVLRRLHYDEAFERIGVTALLRRGNVVQSPARVTSRIVYYAILLLTVLATVGALGLEFLTQTLSGFVFYAPRLLIAALIVVLGTAAAGLLAETVAQALTDAGVSSLGGLRSFIRIALIGLVLILASAVLGIDVTILIALTVILLSAVALTAALAIGLGLRDLSGNIAAGRYVAEGIAEGDWIVVDGVSGTVERLGHAVTILRDLDERVYLVPNAYFLARIVEKRVSAPAVEAD